MKLDNKTIVLTGGSSGVGLEILRQLGPRCTMINLSRRTPDEAAFPFIHIPTDLANGGSVADAIAAVQGHAPSGIDGLFNCAAVQFTPRFDDPAFDPSSIAPEIAINLTSPIELVASLLPCLLRQPEGVILNINSGLGLVPKRESAVYCATKAGLDNFSRGLRAQLAGSRVRVLQAFLPLVDTPMTQGRGRAKLSSRMVAEQIIQGVEQGVADNDIGKVALLRAINRIAPTLAARIMQQGVS